MKNLWNRNNFLGFLAAAFLFSISSGDVFASVVIKENFKLGISSRTLASTDSSDLFLVQTSEITINLEKRMPSQTEIDKLVASRAEMTLKSAAVSETKPYVANAAENLSAEANIIPGTIELVEGDVSFDDIEDPFSEGEEDIPEQNDPLEGYNRWMYGVNEGIYDYFMEPVARGYRAVVHENVRLAIRNVFDNALAPVKFVSSALQGDMDKSARVLSRLVLNTTVGLGGLFDVAGEGYGIESVNEDFDQALGYYGVPTGPYLVLPFLGPSSARDMTGKIFDSFLNPTSHFSPSFLAGAGITLGEKTNSVSFIIDDKKSIDDSALDEYESVRDFYHQYRKGLLNK